jgi:hypothetical protein
MDITPSILESFGVIASIIVIIMGLLLNDYHVNKATGTVRRKTIKEILFPPILPIWLSPRMTPLAQVVIEEIPPI